MATTATKISREEIIESNKLIAKFMGAKYIYHPDYVSTKHWFKFPERKSEVRDNELRYHSSWDSLMPVVEKIEMSPVKRTEYIGGNSDYCNLKTIWSSLSKECYAKFQSETDDKIFSSASSENKIEAVWEAVIEFIKWYNIQQAFDEATKRYGKTLENLGNE